MEPEILFLRYAYPALPCAKQKIMHKDVSVQTIQKLEKMLSGEEPLDKDFIEKTYPSAISELKAISEDYWNLGMIRYYFREVHNKLLKNNDEASEEIKNLCYVYSKAQVLAVTSPNEAEVILWPSKRTRPVKTIFIPDLKDGELVVVHYFYAVERTNFEL